MLLVVLICSNHHFVLSFGWHTNLICADGFHLALVSWNLEVTFNSLILLKPLENLRFALVHVLQNLVSRSLLQPHSFLLLHLLVTLLIRLMHLFQLFLYLFDKLAVLLRRSRLCSRLRILRCFLHSSQLLSAFEAAPPGLDEAGSSILDFHPLDPLAR